MRPFDLTIFLPVWYMCVALMFIRFAIFCSHYNDHGEMRIVAYVNVP